MCFNLLDDAACIEYRVSKLAELSASSRGVVQSATAHTNSQLVHHGPVTSRDLAVLCTRVELKEDGQDATYGQDVARLARAA